MAPHLEEVHFINDNLEARHVGKIRLVHITL